MALRSPKRNITTCAPQNSSGSQRLDPGSQRQRGAPGTRSHGHFKRRLYFGSEERPTHAIWRMKIKHPALHDETLGAGGLFLERGHTVGIRLTFETVEMELG